MSAVSADRRARLGRAHHLAKTHGLDEDAYRDKLEQVTGRRSAKDCSDAQLDAFAAAFPVKQKATNSYTAKIKALWIAAWNLGALDDGSDRALDAFVLRQTGKERLAFVTATDAGKLTEALKDVLKRHGCEIAGDGIQARCAVLIAQWRRLHALGVMRIADVSALESFAERMLKTCHQSLHHFSAPQLDAVARTLGAKLRKAQIR